MRGVSSLGPSSKVSATDRRSRGPRHTEGPNTAEARPRTAHAIAAAPHATEPPAIGSAEIITSYCRVAQAVELAEPGFTSVFFVGIRRLRRSFNADHWTRVKVSVRWT